jgi:alpha-L-rhamnosidase
MLSSPFSQASWIASSLLGSPQCGVPAPYVRKTFSLSRPIQSATLSLTALGLYECEINGQRVGDLVLTPGWTDYRRRVYYQTHDVTGLLQPGENAIGALLGDGWYCGAVGWRPRELYGDRARFLAQLMVTFTDGSCEIVASDASWKTATSPILQNDLLAGETYDARKELPGWSSAGFDDAEWLAVTVLPSPDIALEPPPGPPVRRINEIRPIAVRSCTTSKSIIDLGQNFSGRVRLTIKGTRGQTLKLRYAEVLNSDGSIYTENLRAARVTDYYTCKGSEEEVWEPRFTFHGFRYVEISGLNKDQVFEIVGVVLHSDMRVTGTFSCSNPLLNQLQNNIVWGQKSNFLDIPTDCPQRDERLGWTGDAQVFIRTACFNMDVQGFFHKWVQDLRDAQRSNGAIPPVAPDDGFLGDMEDGGPAWADATIICPWTIYLCYADTKILNDHYESMRRYMEFVAANRCKNNIRSHPDVDKWGGFGDWLALDGSGKWEGGTPRDLIGTALYAYDAEIMSRVAAILGHEEAADHYARLHEEIVNAFRHRFVTPDGLMAAGTQTAYVLALRFGLIPEEARPTAARELVRDIERRDFHLATGFVGTPYLLDVLTQNGYLDVAYKLLEQETFPSWLFPVKNGATTIWERWDGWTPEKGFQDKSMNSFNHYAYGAVGGWMYQTVAGLDLDSAQPGYEHIIFRPKPGGSITWAEAKLQTPRGDAGIRWEISDGIFDSTVTIPLGARATFYPPIQSGEPVVLDAGTHSLSWPI